MDAAPPTGLTDRAPAPEDARAVLALINTCDIEDVGAPDYSLADLTADWAYARFELARDARLLVGADGTVRAYVAVRQYDPGRRYWVDLYVHPRIRGRGAERWAIAFAEDRAGASADAPDASAFVYAEEGSDLADVLRTSGYDDVRRMFRMEIALDGGDGPPGVPVAPGGIEIRTFDPAEARPVHGAIQEAFADEWGFVPEPFEEWAARKFDHAEFDPDTWWIAWDGEEVAGMVLAAVADTVDVGWISTVGVRRRWRGRGLALVLLRTAFRALAERGMPLAALGVDSENPTGATRLYERAGMHVTKCWVRYERPVPVTRRPAS